MRRIGASVVLAPRHPIVGERIPWPTGLALLRYPDLDDYVRVWLSFEISQGNILPIGRLGKPVYRGDIFGEGVVDLPCCHPPQLDVISSRSNALAVGCPGKSRQSPTVMRALFVMRS